MKKIKFLTIIILSLLNENTYSKPTKLNYFKTGAGLSTFLYSQYIYKKKTDNFHIYKVENVNPFDSFMRKKVKWKKNMDKASFCSDILLYGIALGSVPITASIIDGNYSKNLLFYLNVISVNGIITNITKNISSRERPYYRHNPSQIKSNESYKSFYSGHTSTVFAISTSSSLLLSNQFPHKKDIIWLTTFSLSSLTGYYRIASDKHYTTDVIFGALMGIATGYFMYTDHIKRGLKLSLSNNYIQLSYNLE